MSLLFEDLGLVSREVWGAMSLLFEDLGLVSREVEVPCPCYSGI